MIKNTENWLRFYVVKKIKELYPQLVKDVKSQKKHDWVISKFNRNKWYNSIFAALIILVGLACIVHFANICLDYGAFIDQRSSNLATISGMCLSVIVFLMGNMAVKETYAYDLLFEKTKLYPAIFFVLSTLGLFVVLSTLRNVIPANVFGSLVVATGFMFLLVLLIIGYLFSTVIYYINPSQIDAFMSKKLKARADNIFLAGLLEAKSEERYNSVLQQQGAIKSEFSQHFERSFFETDLSFKSESEVKLFESKKRYVEDIDLVALANLVSALKKPLYYDMLALNQAVNPSNDYLFNPDSPMADEDRRKLKKIVYFKNKGTSLLSVSEVRNHFDDRILMYSESGKSVELSRMLEGIDLLYENQKLYRTQAPFDLTENFSVVLQNSLTASIEKNHFECFKLLWSFFFLKSYSAITEGYFLMFSNLLWLNNVAYIGGAQRIGNAAYRKILDYTQIPSNSYEMYFQALKKLEKDNLIKSERVKEFYLKTYNCLNDLLFNMVFFRDENSIKAAMEMLQGHFRTPDNYELRQEINDLKANGITVENHADYKKLKNVFRETKALQTLRRRIVFGLKAWVLHLVDNNTIDYQKGRELTQYMIIRNDDHEDALDDIFFFRGREASLGYLSWMSWSLSEGGLDGKEREISSPSSWLTFGFMAEQIVNYNLPAYLAEPDVDEYQFVAVVIENLRDSQRVFESEFEKWKEILNVIDLKDLKSKTARILDFFSNLAKNQQDAALTNIAEIPIDQNVVETETHKSIEVWNKNAQMYNFFREQGTVEPVHNPSLPFIGHDGYANKMKQFFVAGNDNLNLLPSIAQQTGRMIDDHFFSMLSRDLSYAFDTKSVNDFLVSNSEAMDEIKADVIFADGYDLFMDDDLRKNENFRTRNLGSEVNDDLKIFGWYNNIPIYMVPVNSLLKKIAFANFKKAFVMEYYDGGSESGAALNVEVREIDVDEAESIYNRRYVVNISDEFKKKKILEIQNDIYIKFGASIAFKISDQNAFKIGVIKPNRLDNMSLLN